MQYKERGYLCREGGGSMQDISGNKIFCFNLGDVITLKNKNNDLYIDIKILNVKLIPDDLGIISTAKEERCYYFDEDKYKEIPFKIYYTVETLDGFYDISNKRIKIEILKQFSFLHDYIKNNMLTSNEDKCTCGGYGMYEVVDRITGQVKKIVCQECLKKVDESKYYADLRKDKVND